MISLVKVVTRVWRGEEARLRELEAEGRTIALSAVQAGDHVLKLALGFGEEFWRVGNTWQINPNDCRVEGGLLIIQDGRRVTERTEVETVTRNIEDVRFKA